MTASSLITTAVGRDRVVVDGLVVDAFIGVHDFERSARQRVRFDIEIDTVEHYAAIVRESGRYVSYADVVGYVEQRAASGEHIELVETWAEDVATFVLRNELADSCRVDVRKLDVFDAADGVGVSIQRRRAAAPAGLESAADGIVSRCLVAVGSNLGDRLANVRHGVNGLAAAAGTETIALSGLYETAPVGGPDDQGAYLNAVAVVDTRLSAPDLLALLHRLERECDRKRTIRWGPRTLDLDLLVHGDLVVDDETLVVPHPRLHERRFVMVPVCDVAPDLVHPRLRRTMRDLLDDLPPEPGDLELVATDWHAGDRELVAGAAR